MNLKHNWSEICMPPRFRTNDKTIIVDNYEGALGIIKQKMMEKLEMVVQPLYVLITWSI
jgi:hypothetical protein